MIFSYLMDSGHYSQKYISYKKTCVHQWSPLPDPQSHQQRSLFSLKIDPLGQPKVTAGKDHCFRTYCPYVRTYVRPHFSNLEKQNNRKQCSLLAWLWVWPSGSLMTPVLFVLFCAILKSGDERTDDVCENNDHCRPWLWVGLVDQYTITFLVCFWFITIKIERRKHSNLSKAAWVRFFQDSPRSRGVDVIKRTVWTHSCSLLYRV